ncbi:hypothetical protein F5Y11DRAFT_67589 [Daldinia sp. FL1419]|nr:hypothetical protein F5Y11DRAFT_67589 [Daldinia sp. FL1419]
MAGSIPDLSLPTSPFFNIYSDATVIANPPTLPGGPCNFVDLSRGVEGPKCGCRRFWSRGAFSARTNRGISTGVSSGYATGFPNGNTGSDESAWCMCSHHACFHDDIHDSQPPVAIAAKTGVVDSGQENERPTTGREPLTPVVPDLSFKLPTPTDPGIDFYTFNEFPFPNLVEQDNAPQDQAPTPVPPSSIPDTLSWSNFLRSDPDEGSSQLPPIPSQCLISSQPSSTTSSARVGYLRPFAGKGLGTLSGVRSKLGEPPLEQEEETNPQEENIADPGTDQSVDDGQTVANTPRSSRHGDINERRSLSPPGFDRQAIRQLSDTVQGHERRLDRLENPSLSIVDHDACEEKHDQSDLRITELESRVEEVEKLINDGAQVPDFRSRPLNVNESMTSVASISTVGSEYVASRAELYSQLQALKSQLSQLQGLSSFPSSTRPWEIEVVFLPFPLKSVWMGFNDYTSQHPSGGSVEPDQWTQLPNSSSILESQSAEFTDWAGPELESEWLLARACAPNRIIEQRLRSRGLVKNVTIGGSDARSVHQAISDAFGSLFRTFSRMQANVYHGSTQHYRVAKFLGLQSPWVPLRKVHRDSRLRFLSPAEMVTPVTWDVPFLRSSVVMKATGVQRLFITHPEAYLQDQDAYDNGWSWQRLRELSRVYADSQSTQEVPEADALEDCWAWNDNLDEHPPSTNVSQSYSLRRAAQHNWHRMTMSPAPGLLTGTARPSPSLGTNRSASRFKSPAMFRERKASKPPHIRTNSMPPMEPTLVSPAQAKRRVTSYVQQYERRPSPQVTRVAPPTNHVAALVKRRGTRSPSVRPRNTPRWSTSSPSPVPEVFVPRNSTPFYATPYSNAPGFERRASRSVVIVDGGDIGNSGSETEHHDGEEYMDEDDDSAGDSPMVDFSHPEEDTQESWQDGQLRGTEDEVWPGIEDAENRHSLPDIDIHEDDDIMSGTDAFDRENEDDARSQGSSVPSEYPSNQPWVDTEEAFRVYEDVDPAGK